MGTNSRAVLGLSAAGLLIVLAAYGFGDAANGAAAPGDCDARTDSAAELFARNTALYSGYGEAELDALLEGFIREDRPLGCLEATNGKAPRDQARGADVH